MRKTEVKVGEEYAVYGLSGVLGQQAGEGPFGYHAPWRLRLVEILNRGGYVFEVPATVEVFDRLAWHPRTAPRVPVEAGRQVRVENGRDIESTWVEYETAWMQRERYEREARERDEERQERLAAAVRRLGRHRLGEGDDFYLAGGGSIAMNAEQVERLANLLDRYESEIGDGDPDGVPAARLG